MDPAPPIANAPDTKRTRVPLFLLGILFFIAGPAIYAVQTGVLHHFKTPWHLPLLATAGCFLMLMSVWQRGGVLRIVGLVIFSVFCGIEWFGLAIAMRTPEYTGPVAVGLPLPTFAATRSDGAAFTDRDLVQGKSTLLVFFRGRW